MRLRRAFGTQASTLLDSAYAAYAPPRKDYAAAVADIDGLRTLAQQAGNTAAVAKADALRAWMLSLGADRETGTVGGTVPATLSLTLGAPASFGAFTPALTKEYETSSTATVTSTAGDATLSVSNPGYLANGAYTLAEPLRVAFSKSVWTGPVSNDNVTIAFKQLIKATDPLRTGSYSKKRDLHALDHDAVTLAGPRRPARRGPFRRPRHDVLIQDRFPHAARSSLADLKERNEWRVLEVVRDVGEVSRAELVVMTGLSRSTIANVTAELLERGLVIERAPSASRRPGRGRPGSVVALRADAGIAVGAAVDREQIRVAVVDLAAEVLAQGRLPIEPAADGLAVLELARAADP